MKKLIMVCLIMAICVGFIAVIPPVKANSTATTEPRTVLVEIFTSTGCSVCPNTDKALSKLADEYKTKLAVLEYHVDTGEGGDPFITEHSDERWSYYYTRSGVVNYTKPLGTPTGIVDGVIEHSGSTGSEEGDYKVYKEDIDSRLNVSTSINIRVAHSIDGNKGNINVYVKAVDTVSKSNLRLRFVVFEDNVYYEDGKHGGPYYRFIVRDVLSEEQLAISKGEVKTFIKTFTVDSDWNKDELGIVVFVQTDENVYDGQVNDEILQASISKFGVSLQSDKSVVEIGAGGTGKIDAIIKNTKNEKDTYDITIGKEMLPSGWSSNFCIDDICYQDRAILSLDANDSEIVSVAIISPENAQVGLSGEVILITSLQTNPYIRSAILLKATIVPGPTIVELEIISTSKNSITLSWSENTDANFTRYEIHMSNQSNFIPDNSTLIEVITEQITTIYEVTGLSEDALYYFKIRVVNEYGTTDSDEVSGKTLAAEKKEKHFISGFETFLLLGALGITFILLKGKGDKYEKR